MSENYKPSRFNNLATKRYVDKKIAEGSDNYYIVEYSITQRPQGEQYTLLRPFGQIKQAFFDGKTILLRYNGVTSDKYSHIVYISFAKDENGGGNIGAMFDASDKTIVVVNANSDDARAKN